MSWTKRLLEIVQLGKTEQEARKIVQNERRISERNIRLKNEKFS